MCGRYRLSRRMPSIEKHFDTLCHDGVEWNPRYNIAPSQSVPVIRRTGNFLRELSFVQWGFRSSWSTHSRVPATIFNARSEAVTITPTFREAIVSQRCLIPADGFYEWKSIEEAKQPHCLEIEEGQLFAFAGLWDRYFDANDLVIETCTILTTAANALVTELHDRMPVILHPRDYDLWLDTSRGIDSAMKLLLPYRGHMRCYPVSTRLNHVQNDSSDCAIPVHLEQPMQGLLFQ